MPSALSPAGVSKSSVLARYPEAAVLPVFAQSGRNRSLAPARRELRSEHRALQIAYFSMGYGDSPAQTLLNSTKSYLPLPSPVNAESGQERLLSASDDTVTRQ